MQALFVRAVFNNAHIGNGAIRARLANNIELQIGVLGLVRTIFNIEAADDTGINAGQGKIIQPGGGHDLLAGNDDALVAVKGETEGLVKVQVEIDQGRGRNVGIQRIPGIGAVRSNRAVIEQLGYKEIGRSGRAGVADRNVFAVNALGDGEETIGIAGRGVIHDRPGNHRAEVQIEITVRGDPDQAGIFIPVKGVGVGVVVKDAGNDRLVKLVDGQILDIAEVIRIEKTVRCLAEGGVAEGRIDIAAAIKPDSKDHIAGDVAAGPGVAGNDDTVIVIGRLHANPVTVVVGVLGDIG